MLGVKCLADQSRHTVIDVIRGIRCVLNKECVGCVGATLLLVNYVGGQNLVELRLVITEVLMMKII